MSVKPFLCTSGLLVFLMGSAVAAKEPAMEYRFQTSVPGSGCWFDRHVATPAPGLNGILMANVTVRCHAQQAYQLTTDVITTLPAVTQDGRWQLKSVMTPHGESCEQALNQPGYQFDQNGYASPSLLQGEKTWTLCLQALPLSSQVTTVFPLHGAINVSLSPAGTIEHYPEGTQVTHVLFANDSAALAPAQREHLAIWLKDIGAVDSYRFELHGHASDSGERQYNHDLSLNRLVAARTYLVGELGLPASALWSQAWGEQRPSALNRGEQYDRLNRRVTVVAIPVSATIIESAFNTASPVQVSTLPANTPAIFNGGKDD